jgi:ligand-binding sensor domain-containing protein
MSIRKSLLVLGLVLCGLVSFAQDEGLRFERLGSENYILEKGLSQNSVYTILQDRRGFMWFGTWDGLNMFDGYDFRVFRPDLYGRRNDISHQTITHILEDSDGTLWIATEGGLNQCIQEPRRFKHYIRDSRKPGTLSSDTLNYLLIDSRQRLWIATENGLNLFDRKQGTFQSWHRKRGSGDGSQIVRWLAEDEDGSLWLATRAGVGRFDPGSGKTKWMRRGATDGPSSDTVHCVIAGRDGMLWFGTEKGLDRYDPASGRIERYSHDPDNPQSIGHPIVNVVFEDQRGRVWVGTEGGGLALFDPDSKSFSRYRYESDDPLSLSNDYISAIYQDRSGTIWIGTKWKGVNKLSPSISRFDHYFSRSDQNNSLNNNLVWSIYEDANRRLWIATDQGVNILDRKTGKYSYLRHRPGDPNSLVSDKVSVIAHEKNGPMWFGTFDAGCSRYDPLSGKFTHFTSGQKDKRRLPDNDIGDIIQDGKGRVWIGTGRGLVRYDPLKDEMTDLGSSTLSSREFLSQNITCLYEDREGYLWIGSYHGLGRLDTETLQLRIFRHDPDVATSVSSDAIFSIYEDRQGRLWIGTRGGGLNVMDRKLGTFGYYVEEDGLPNNVVYSTLEDEEGNLWMSTNYGLSMFDPRREAFVNYDVRDGLQSNEFNLGAAFRNSGGEMFFGGMYGFNAFFPSRIRQNVNIPPVVITGFKVFDQWLDDALHDGDTVFLSQEDNFFTISFSALDYANPLRNLYRYRLENFDKDWVMTGAEKRFSTYTRVPPGTYTFRVTGSNSDGIWNEDGATLTIVVAPAWYATWAFRILAGLLIIGAVAGAIVARFRRLRRRHEMEKKVLAIQNEIIDIRQKALRLQMNPHFIFNSLNSIQSFILANDTDKAIHYLSKFSQLMRTILSNSSESFVPLRDELSVVRNYLDIERLRFSEKFDYEIDLEGDLDDEFVEIPPMIVQPYIENAIIHGLVNKEGTGHIRIRIEDREDVMHWEIEDDGIGREASRRLREAYGTPRKSRGMMITRQRLEMLNTGEEQRYGVKITDLSDEAGNPRGTLVVIDMPVKAG